MNSFLLSCLLTAACATALVSSTIQRQDSGPAYTLATVMAAIEEKTDVDELPYDLYRFPGRLAKLFHSAGETLEMCSKNIVWNMADEANTKLHQKKLVELINIMELEGVTGYHLDLLPAVDVYNWMHLFGQSLERILTNALPPPKMKKEVPPAKMTKQHLKKIEEEKKQYLAWLARAAVVGNIVENFPCDGHVPQETVQEDWTSDYARFVDSYQYNPDEFAVTAANEKSAMISEETMKPRRRSAAATSRIANLILEARWQAEKTLKLTWNVNVCAPDDQLGDRGFNANQTVRDEYVTHLRRAVPYLALPNTLKTTTRLMPDRLHTARCRSTISGLNDFKTFLFATLNQILNKEILQLQVTDWIQSLNGLKNLVTIPKHLADTMKTYGREVMEAEAELAGKVNMAVEGLTTWVTLSSLRPLGETDRQTVF